LSAHSFSRRTFLTLPLLIALLPLFAPNAAAQMPRQKFTFDDLYGRAAIDFSGDLPYVSQWLKDGEHYLEYGYNGLMKVEARTGKSEPFHDARRMEADLAAIPSIGLRAAGALANPVAFQLDSTETKALLVHRNDIFTYNFPANRVIRVTQTPDEHKTNQTFSPDGKTVAYVKKGNLYVAQADRPSSEKQLTKDGNDLILNGRLDWVYEEEVYGRGQTTGYKWSPDGRYIAFLRIDDRPVRPFIIVDNVPRQQIVESWRYPLAGDPNPNVTLGVVAVDGSTPPKFVDLSKYPEADRLLVRFSWHPDSRRLFYQVQNRIATFLDLNVADVVNGKVTTLFRETTPAWVEIIDNPQWLKDGTFLWLSERTGYRHIYRYKPDGSLLGAVTQGEWDVRRVQRLDEDGQYIYFTASEHSPLANHAYRIKLDGTDFKRLTESEGEHEVDFSPSGALFLDTRSDYNTPPELRVREGRTGRDIRLVADNADLKKTIARYQMPKAEFVQVKARDGFLLEAVLLKPADFDPNKKYPVYCPVYAGPGAQTVQDEFEGDSFDRLLVSKGILVWRCDNRSASGKGAKSAWTAYKRLGVGELQDIEDGVSYLKSLPYVDGNRLAISGWSYGGFMVEYALTHSKSFKVGIAGAGVSDWHLYDTIYTERYMDTPKNNPEGYKNTAPVQAAANLSGKLLILHGMMDDNVHLQNSTQLIYALQKAGKDFEVMFYPGSQSRHGIGDRDLNRHLRQRELDFLDKNL
jgi:dipeptidyl-peptidase-4